MNKSFLQECLNLGILVVPFTAYDAYNKAGSYDETTNRGIKFICVAYDPRGVTHEGRFYLELETYASDTNLVADTPEEALMKFKAKHEL